MQSSPNPEKPGAWLGRRSWLTLVLLTVTLAGCKTGADKKAGDPLLGEAARPPGSVPASASNPPHPSSQTKVNGIPPVPTSKAASTNAELASIPGSRTLAINPAQPAPGSFPTQAGPTNQWTGTAPQVAPLPTGFPTPGASAPPTGAAPPSSLMPPSSFTPPPGVSSITPKVMPIPRETAPSPVLTTGSFSAAQTTQEILQSQLKARGVQWQKSEVVPEGVRFSCIVPNRNNPESSRIFEAVAPDYASAVQAALLQIDQQK